MTAGDTELRRLHARRRWLLRERRLGLPGWDLAEFARIRARIDELEMAGLGLTWWRNQLLMRLRTRHLELLLERARRLLDEPPLRPVATITFDDEAGARIEYHAEGEALVCWSDEGKP
jgi:hypothetical protein